MKTQTADIYELINSNIQDWLLRWNIIKLQSSSQFEAVDMLARELKLEYKHIVGNKNWHQIAQEYV